MFKVTCRRASLQQLWDASITRGVQIFGSIMRTECTVLVCLETGASYTENVINTNGRHDLYSQNSRGYVKQGQEPYIAWKVRPNNMIAQDHTLWDQVCIALRKDGQELMNCIIAGRLSPGMLTDFITKTPDGDQSEVIADDV